MKNFLSYAGSIIERRNKIRSILIKSNAVSTTQSVEEIEVFASHQKEYRILSPDDRVTINYDILASDLIKSGYGNLKDFSDQVIKMLKLFCDDDDQISIKVRELEVNMRSILREFILTFPEGVPVCKELRGPDMGIYEGGPTVDNSEELIRFISERCPVYLSEMYNDEYVAFTAIRTYAIEDVRKAIKEFQTGGNNESSTTVK